MLMTARTATLKPALILGAVALAMIQPALAQTTATQDPCQEAAIHAQLESLMAPGYARVCDAVGSVSLTPDCMNYYLRVTDTAPPPSEDARAALAAACEASMPGATALGCIGPDCRPAKDVPVADPTDAMECGEGLECRPPEDEPVPLDDDTGALETDTAPRTAQADAALDLAFWEAIEDSNDPAMYRAYLDQFPRGVFRVIAAARLAALTGTASQAPATPPASATTPATTPTDAYREAMAIMDRAYSGDLAGWDAAARRALPLFQRAGDGGIGAAWIELGALYENGIGVTTDNPRAIEYFLMAGESGLSEGYLRALMLLDQTGQATRFVDAFLALARQDRGAALAVFDSVSASAPVRVQRYLGDRGYYAGALDGRFGAGSQSALDAYLSGSPPPPVAAPAPAPAAPDADLARALQSELSRVGCYQGPIDGKWGPGSARAMQNFNHWWGSAAPTGAPTAAGLDTVRAAPGLVCGTD